jgi:hypothetical protein
MNPKISFRCASCQARLTASVRLIGQARPCPACGEHVVLQPIIPDPASPLAAWEDGPWPARRELEESLCG